MVFPSNCRGLHVEFHTCIVHSVANHRPRTSLGSESKKKSLNLCVLKVRLGSIPTSLDARACEPLAPNCRTRVVTADAHARAPQVVYSTRLKNVYVFLFSRFYCARINGDTVCPSHIVSRTEHICRWTLIATINDFLNDVFSTTVVAQILVKFLLQSRHIEPKIPRR